MRTKTRNCKKGRYRQLMKGGQPRWPAPTNPTPAVECRFPNFRPLVLSQFGGKKSRKVRTVRKQSKKVRKQSKKVRKQSKKVKN